MGEEGEMRRGRQGERNAGEEEMGRRGEMGGDERRAGEGPWGKGNPNLNND